MQFVCSTEVVHFSMQLSLMRFHCPIITNSGLWENVYYDLLYNNKCGAAYNNNYANLKLILEYVLV